MAKLIKTDGTEVEVVPAKGKRWTLDELQSHVGGPIELMPWQPLRFVINEEGKLRGLPSNLAATALLHEQIAQKLGCSVEQLIGEVGRRLRYLPRLCGNVLLLDPKEKM